MGGGFGAFDRIVVRTTPVMVPRGFRGPVLASVTSLEGDVIRVHSCFRPYCPDGGAKERGGGLPLVTVAERLDYGARDFEARGPLL